MGMGDTTELMPGGGFQMQPLEVSRMSAQVKAVGAQVQDLAGLVRSGVCIDRDPPLTAEAWRQFATAWARGINEVGWSVKQLGGRASAGGQVYVTTDATVVPAIGSLCDR